VSRDDRTPEERAADALESIAASLEGILEHIKKLELERAARAGELGW